MIGIEILPGAIGRPHRALIVLRVDQEEGGCRIGCDRRQGQIEPGAAVADIQDLARDFGIGCLVSEPSRNLERPGFGLRDVGPVRHVHVDEELVAFAERKHLLGQAAELRQRQHDQHDAHGEHDWRKTQSGTQRGGIEALHPRGSGIFICWAALRLPISQTVSAGRI